MEGDVYVKDHCNCFLLSFILRSKNGFLHESNQPWPPYLILVASIGQQHDSACTEVGSLRTKNTGRDSNLIDLW